MVFRIPHLPTVFSLVLGLACTAMADPGVGSRFGVHAEVSNKTTAELKQHYTLTCTGQRLSEIKAKEPDAGYQKVVKYCGQLAITLRERGIRHVPDAGAPAGEFGKMK